jgi:hypothetical protein
MDAVAETPSPGRTAIVIGLGKGDAGYFDGAACEATLIERLSPTSEAWFVHCPGDRDEGGRQIKRIRKFVSLSTKS